MGDVFWSFYTRADEYMATVRFTQTFMNKWINEEQHEGAAAGP